MLSNMEVLWRIFHQALVMTALMSGESLPRPKVKYSVDRPCSAYTAYPGAFFKSGIDDGGLNVGDHSPRFSSQIQRGLADLMVQQTHAVQR